MLTRKCTKCGVTKSLDQFYQQSKKYKDGSPKYDARCIQCMRGAALKRYHDLARRSKVPKVSEPLSFTQRLAQHAAKRAQQPPPKPSKPPTEHHYVVDEYSQVDPNEDL